MDIREFYRRTYVFFKTEKGIQFRMNSLFKVPLIRHSCNMLCLIPPDIGTCWWTCLTKINVKIRRSLPPRHWFNKDAVSSTGCNQKLRENSWIDTLMAILTKIMSLSLQTKYQTRLSSKWQWIKPVRVWYKHTGQYVISYDMHRIVWCEIYFGSRILIILGFSIHIQNPQNCIMFHNIYHISKILTTVWNYYNTFRWVWIHLDAKFSSKISHTFKCHQQRVVWYLFFCWFQQHYPKSSAQKNEAHKFCFWISYSLIEFCLFLSAFFAISHIK